jgi:hypothetical protein
MKLQGGILDFFPGKIAKIFVALNFLLWPER